LHESVVQSFESLQIVGVPGAHSPPVHRSPTVHALLSVHGFELLLWAQPVGPGHESSVHALPSSQLGGGPPAHDPAVHMSFVVQALLSLQGKLLGVKTQPPGAVGLQVSFVHGFKSSQIRG
jgi:hypothetical protein